jgi:hypothetical protein
MTLLRRRSRRVLRVENMRRYRVVKTRRMFLMWERENTRRRT